MNQEKIDRINSKILRSVNASLADAEEEINKGFDEIAVQFDFYA